MLVDPGIKERLIKIRKLRGITQKELAKKAKVSQGTIQHLETGRSESSKYLAQIAAALDVSVEYLTSGKEDTKLTSDEHRYFDTVISKLKTSESFTPEKALDTANFLRSVFNLQDR